MIAESICAHWRVIITAFALAITGCSGNNDGPRIIVSGASGQLGGLVVEALLARDVPASDLILVSRTPERLESYAALGASVRFGDFTQPDSLRAAYAEGERMLLISVGGGAGDRPALHKAAIDAAREAGVGYIAYTSYVNVDLIPDSPIAPDHLATEQLLRDSGLAWTMLRNHLYMNGLVEQAATAARSGELRSSVPADSRVAYVTREDCAAAAAAVLFTPGHEYQTYNITGPELIGPREIAETTAAVTGVPVQHIVVNEEDAYRALVDSGVGERVAAAMIGLERELGSPYLQQTSNAVLNLTGRPPMSLRELLQAHKAELL